MSSLKKVVSRRNNTLPLCLTRSLIAPSSSSSICSMSLKSSVLCFSTKSKRPVSLFIYYLFILIN